MISGKVKKQLKEGFLKNFNKINKFSYLNEENELKKKEIEIVKEDPIEKLEKIKRKPKYQPPSKILK